MTKKKEIRKVDWRVVVTALVCLTGAEIYALSQGINGTIFSIYIAIVAGIAGFVIPSPLKTT